MCAGSDATFRVEVSGDPPMVFLWTSNDVPVTSGVVFTPTNSTLTFTNVQFANDNTRVFVLIYNPVGFTQSVTAVLHVPDPHVCSPPADVCVLPGETIEFQAHAVGTPPLSYRWWFQRFASTLVQELTNDGRVVGADTPALTIFNATIADAGKYWMTVTNGLGQSAKSSEAQCCVGPPPTATNLMSRIVRIYSPTVFDATYTGVNPRTYQWYRNDVPIPGATDPVLLLASVERPEVGVYHVVVSNPGGSAASEKAHLQVRLSLAGTTPIFREEATDELTSLTNAVVAAFVPPPTAVFHGVPLLFSTYNATAAMGEASRCGVPASHSMWVLYTSPRTEVTRVSTEGSDFDTVVAVYTWNGNPKSAPTQVGCDNNSGYDGQDSTLLFSAAARQNYYIAVDGLGGATGTVRLQVGENIRKYAYDQANGTFRFELAGPFWFENSLLTATNFMSVSNWFTVLTMPATNQDWIIGYTNTTAASDAVRFYSVSVNTNSAPP